MWKCSSEIWCSRNWGEGQKLNVGQSFEECRKKEAGEGRVRGNSWVRSAWVMGNELSTVLQYCFFSLPPLFVSVDPGHQTSQQKSGRTVGRLEGWRDEVTEDKGVTGSLNGRRLQPCFALNVTLTNCRTWWTVEVRFIECGLAACRKRDR